MAEGVVTDSNLPLFSAEEVQQHSTEKDAWIIHRERSTMSANFLNAIRAGKLFYLLTRAYGVDEIKRNYMNTRLLGCV